MSDYATDFHCTMNSYYDDDLDDYSNVPLVEQNPDFEGWTGLTK